MFKSFAALALIGAASALDQASFEFVKYVAQYGKSYSTLLEYNARQGIFAARDKMIDEWNADLEHTSQMGHNKMSDWTESEYSKLRGLKEQAPRHYAEEVFRHDASQPLKGSVNWVTAGNVGAVKDQGQCGSCWAFSATGSVESAISVATGNAPGNYSEQQLVSCSSAYGNEGCNGGWYYSAWQYMEKTAQVSTASYPYTSGNNGITGSCNVPADSGVAMVSSYVKVGESNDDIMAALDQKPVSVAVDAMFPAFQFYTSGVVTQNCGHMLDHAIMAVGYGTDPVYGAYFLCRNSWGSSWGDQGYLKIGQSTTGGAPGICGINSEVYYVNAYTV